MAPQLRLDQIRNLVNQWEQLVGYQFTVPDWAVNEMADHPDFYQSLYNVGQYMAYHVGTEGGAFIGELYNNMPWAQWGMTALEYHSKLEAYDTAFINLTGQSAPPDVVTLALAQHQGSMTGSQFQTWLLAQSSIRNQYGWLKYGLDFNQFQTQKLQMRTNFGQELSDAEAVTQLQYLHASQGANVGVAAQPTLGQVEKKQAQTGISGSVAR